MKYIKLFEGWEDVVLYYDSLLEEVKDFTEQSLAYLVDEGWEINFELNNTTKLINYMYPTDSKLVVISIENNEYISWDSIKDKILPFFQLLERRYELEDSSRNSSRYYRVKSYKPYVIYDEECNGICYSLEELLDTKSTKSLLLHHLVTDKLVIRIKDRK